MSQSVDQRASSSRSPADQVDWRRLRALLVVGDALVLWIAFAMASLLRLSLEPLLLSPALDIERHLTVSVLLVFTLIVIFRGQGLYDFDNILAGTREYALVAEGITYAMALAAAVSFFAGGEPLISRSWLLFSWSLGVGSVVALRFFARRVVRHMRRRRGILQTRIAVVGASSLGIAVAQQLRAAVNEGLEVIGFLDEYLPLGQEVAPDLTVIGRPRDLVLAGARRGASSSDPVAVADEYVLIPEALPHERMEELTRIMLAPGGPVLRLPATPGALLTNGLLVAERGMVPLVTLRRARISGLDAILKRLLDIVGAAAGLAVLALPVGLTLGWARLRGVRPLLTHARIRGSSGSAEGLWLLSPKVCTAPSVRGFPALVSVLRGRLSLVGPRPIALDEAADRGSAPGLTAVKPGLTGPWRLQGANASLHDQERSDLAYVRDYSIWEDLRILWRSTAPGTPRRPTEPLGRWERPTGTEPLERPA